jgi:hypothetical protein
MSNIDFFFQIEGCGPKLLEFELEPSTTEAIPYLNKAGHQSFYWYCGLINIPANPSSAF